MKFFITFLILIISIYSCSIQKRIYNNGYHITLNKGIKSNSEIEKMSSIEHYNKVNSNDIYSTKHDSILQNKLKINSSFSISSNKLISTNSCDTIFKKDGSFILAQTVLIHSKTLLYKNCGDNSTKTQSISRDEVAYFVNSTTGITFLKDDICDTIFNKDGTFILAKMVRIHKGIIQYKKCDGSSKETEYVYTDEVTHFKNSKNHTTLISTKECDTLFLKNGRIILAKMVRVGTTKTHYKKCEESSNETEEIYTSDLKSSSNKSIISRDSNVINPWTLAFLISICFTFIILGALLVSSLTSPFLAVLAFFSIMISIILGLSALLIYLLNKK